MASKPYLPTARKSVVLRAVLDILTAEIASAEADEEMGSTHGDDELLVVTIPCTGRHEQATTLEARCLTTCAIQWDCPDCNHSHHEIMHRMKRSVLNEQPTRGS